MAKYQIKSDAYLRIDGADVYFRASPEDPRIIDVPDDTEPGAKFIPLDGAAEAAKKKLLDFRAQPPDKKEAEIRKRLDEQEAEEVKLTKEAFKATAYPSGSKGGGGGGGGTEHHGGTELSNPVPAGAHERGKEKRSSDKTPL